MDVILCKSLLVVLLITLSHSSLAYDHQQTTPKDNTITAPIYKLFDAMREHDQDKILAQFTSKALLPSSLTNKMNWPVFGLPLLFILMIN